MNIAGGRSGSPSGRGLRKRMGHEQQVALGQIGRRAHADRHDIIALPQRRKHRRALGFERELFAEDQWQARQQQQLVLRLSRFRILRAGASGGRRHERNGHEE